MMRIENDIRSRVNQIDVSTTVNQYLNIMLQKEENKETKTTTKKINQDTYQRIKTKASIITNDKRDLQEKMSLIQVQEQKIAEIENTLKNAQNDYLQAIQNGKKEESKQNIKVRQLSKKITDLKDKFDKNQIKAQQINDSKEEYITNEEEIITKINEVLQKINSVKKQISQYKAEFIKLTQEVDSNKAKVRMQTAELQQCLDESKYITEGININQYEYMDLTGSVKTGTIIDIYI